jgi:hypothetical protein
MKPGIVSSQGIVYPALLPPDELQFTLLAGPKVRLTWQDPNPDEDGHRVYRSATSMDPNDLPAPLAALGVDVEAYDDEAVEENETWFYRVSAFRGDGEAVSDEIEVTVVEPDSNVVFLLGMGDTHGDKDWSDDGPVGHTISFTASSSIGPVIDTSFSMFGKSAHGPTSTTGNRLWLASAEALHLADNDFCIEGFFAWEEITTAAGLCGRWDGGSANGMSWELRYSSGQLIFRISETGNDQITKFAHTWAPTLDTFYHIAVTFDGTLYRLFIDGQLADSDGDPITLFDAQTDTADFSVFSSWGFSTPVESFRGWIEELRVVNGDAVYTDTFTPPSEPFPRD